MRENVKKKKKFTKDTVIKYIFVYGFLSVQIVCFAIFYIGINLNSILLAFDVPKGRNLFYNFDYFINTAASSEPVFKLYLPNTLKFFLVSWILLLIGFIFCYFIYKKIPGYRFFRVMFFLPSIISATVLVALYKKIIGVDGPVVWVYKKLFHPRFTPEFLADSRTALPAIMAYSIWTGFGSNILLLGGAMARLPEDVIEYGKLEGIRPMREMFTVILPMIWPTISTMIILIMTGIFTSSGPILLFTEGAYKTTTISYFIWTKVYNQASGNYPVASAVGLFFTVIGFPIVILTRVICGWLDKGVSY